MNKLWVFGDSYSEPFYKNAKWRIPYLEWKGYMPKYYGEIVAEKCNLIHINNAIGGTDNYTILDTIAHNVDKIEKEDTIIIGWSNTIRFRVVGNENAFHTIRPGSLEYVLDSNRKNQTINLSDETLTELSVNRDNAIYINELNNYIKLLNYTFKDNKIIHWSPFSQHKYGLNTTLKNLVDYESIRTETNGVVDDGHFSSNAHLILADELTDIINNYNLYNKRSVVKSIL